jgi:hypothetical protein
MLAGLRAGAVHHITFRRSGHIVARLLVRSPYGLERKIVTAEGLEPAADPFCGARYIIDFVFEY